MHHNKANGHEKRHRSDNPNLGFPGHTFALDIALQIVFVELGANEPDVQPFRAFSEAESCQQQEWESRKQR